MKRILLGATILAAIGAQPASAALRIAMSVGGSSTLVTDGGVGDLDGLPNEVIVGQQNLGGVVVSGTFGNSSKLPSPDGDALNISNLLISNPTSATETLLMAISDNGYPGSENCFMTAVSGTWDGIGKSTAVFSFFVDGGNVLGAANSTNAPGAFITKDSDSADSGPLAFSFEGDNPFFHGTPFSMTELMVFKLAPGAELIGNSVGMEAAPEASTWVMLATGFGMLSMFGLRRKPRLDLNLG